MIRLPEELDFHSVTYADGTDATWRHAWYATCMHAWCIACRSIQLSPVSGSQIVEIVGKTWRSVEDAKVKGTQKVGGAGKRKKEGPFLSLVSSRFFFVCFLFSFLFLFCFVFFMDALSRFSGRYYLGAWNIRKPRRVFRLATSEAGA